MRIPLLLVAIASASVALTGCSSSASTDAADEVIDSWEAAPDDAVSVDCATLLEDWAADADDAPNGCWTMQVTDDLAERFAETSSSFAAHADVEALHGPACMGSDVEGERVALCSAIYEVEGATVILNSGVTVSDLTPEVLDDPTVEAMHEITIFSTVDPDAVNVVTADFDTYYTLPVS